MAWVVAKFAKKETMKDMRYGTERRSALLLGEAVMERLHELRVLIVGVGGVGSWCAEALARTGVGHLTLVDCDRVCTTNVNRQLMATTETIGRVKVDALREHLLTVAPEARIEARCERYSMETAGGFDLDGYDYVVDAIDSLSDKALLILNACRSKAELISSMGAALKVDASQVMVGEFWSSKGCPLARALRKKFKREGTLPERKFRCVFSPEVQENSGKGARCGSESCPVAKRVAEENDGVCERDWCGQKEEANGSLVYITATFGMRIAGEIIKDCYEGRGGRRRDV